jgi:amino acid permease
MILADTFQALLATAGFAFHKTAVLGAVTTLVLLPLCLLKDLSSLAPFSLLGSLGMIYTTVAMAIRYFGKAYAASGPFAADLPKALRPAFGSAGASAALSPATSILVGMLSTAYMAHFNAPKFYTELKDNTVPRFAKVVGISFAMSISIFASVAALGFLTFGGASSGLILNNYSTRDSLMGLSRFAVALSLVFSYPLAFTGARDGVLDLFKLKDKSNGFLNTLTVGMLGGISVLATIIPDVSFVMALAG